MPAAKRPVPIVTKPCQRCGTSVTKRSRGNRSWLCIDCACEAVRDAATQMIEQRGPLYDKWLARTHAELERRARRAG